MKKILLISCVLCLMVQTGCTKSLRYTHDEIRDFSPSVQDRIMNGEIETGMTMLQVRYAWGGPDMVNVLEPTDDGEVRVEWIYKKLHVFTTHLFFTNDRLTEIISTTPGIAK